MIIRMCTSHCSVRKAWWRWSSLAKPWWRTTNRRGRIWSHFCGWLLIQRDKGILDLTWLDGSKPWGEMASLGWFGGTLNLRTPPYVLVMICLKGKASKIHWSSLLFFLLNRFSWGRLQTHPYWNWTSFELLKLFDLPDLNMFDLHFSIDQHGSHMLAQHLQWKKALPKLADIYLRMYILASSLTGINFHGIDPGNNIYIIIICRQGEDLLIILLIYSNFIRYIKSSIRGIYHFLYSCIWIVLIKINQPKNYHY